MKITKSQLKQIIKEELHGLNESTWSRRQKTTDPEGYNVEQEWEQEQKLSPSGAPAMSSEFVDISRWWEYEDKDVMTHVYWQQRQLPPLQSSNSWAEQWESVKKQLEERYPRK